MLKNALLITPLLVTVLISGCVMPGYQVPISHRMTPEEPGVRLFGERDAITEEPYRIGIPDVLKVVVKRHPEMSARMQVSESGNITLPLIHSRIKVEGLSVEEVAERVKAEVAPYVVMNPEVEVVVAEVRSKVYYVLGAVSKMGKFSLGKERIRLREALYRAGLNTDIAAMWGVYIIEPDIDNPRWVIVNAEEILLGRMRYNITLKPNDIVFVPTTTSYKINKFIGELLGRMGEVQSLDANIKYFSERFKGAEPRIFNLERK